MKIVPETNFVSPARDHVLADELARGGVRRELDAVEVGAQDVCGRAAEQRLRRAGRPLEQDVTAGHRGDEEELDRPSLADDDLADLRLRALAQLVQAHVLMQYRHAGRPPSSRSVSSQTIVGISVGGL